LFTSSALRSINEDDATGDVLYVDFVVNVWHETLLSFFDIFDSFSSALGNASGL